MTCGHRASAEGMFDNDDNLPPAISDTVVAKSRNTVAGLSVSGVDETRTGAF
jgi:hypothetical protein